MKITGPDNLKNANRYTLNLKHHFDSAHKLNLDYDSPCQDFHGHRWEIEIEIQTQQLDKNGMIVDFKKIKAVIDKLDHKCLNDILNFNPTAENISKYLYEQIQLLGEFDKIKVVIFESPDASITYNLL